MEPAIMQQENERRRLTVPGHRTDTGERCTLLIVHEVAGGCWVFYPHGAAQLGVPVARPDAVTVADAIRTGISDQLS